MTILNFDDYTLMHDNDVIIETVFERSDLTQVDNEYSHWAVPGFTNVGKNRCYVMQD